MKTILIKVFAGFMLVIWMFQTTLARDITAPKWDDDTQAIYDLLVAQMQNTTADYAGSVDTLVKFAKKQKDDRLFARAYRTLLQTERYAEAVDIVSEWKDNTDLSIDKFYILALVLNEETDKALSELDKIIADNSDEQAVTLLTYSQLFMSNWYHPQIAKVVERLYERYPDSDVLADIYVQLLRYQGDTDKAVSILDKLLFKTPRDLNLLQEKSDAYRYSLRLNDAENVWKTVLKDYPNETTFQLAYAQFLYDRYDFPRTQTVLEQIKVDDDLAFSVALLKMLNYVQLGDYEKAKNSFDWDNLTPMQRDKANYNYADQLLKKSQYSLAEKAFAAVTDDSELALPAALKIAEIKYRDSRDQGDAWFIEIQEKFQLDNVDIVREKASALQGADKDQQAADLLKDYLDKNPSNDDVRYMRALVIAEMQRDEEAIADLKRLYAISPSNTDVQNALGYTLLSQPDEIDYATSLIKKSLFSNPGSPAVIDSMGWAYYQKKAYSAALPFFRYAYSHYSDGEIMGHYIMGLAANGQLSVAKKLYQLEMQFDANAEKIKRITAPRHKELTE